MTNKIKTAVVYDWANQIGGAERLVEIIAKCFPGSDLFTSVYNPKTAPWAKNFNKVTASFINNLPFGKNKYYCYFPILPYAFENFDFNRYNLVVSVTSYPGKFIITHPETCHINYCLTPTRFLWEKKNSRNILFPLLNRLRIADQLAAKRADFTFTSCKNTAAKIKKYYQTDAEVIYPEIDTDKFIPAQERKKGEYFLIVSRLVKYKKVDLAIKAFNKLGWPLKIIGSGREENKLKSIAKNNIEFLGNINDQQLISYYQNCQALVFSQEEDFGLVPLEAQSCGKPVIAYEKGGVLETVVKGVTGEFFAFQTESCLIELLNKFDSEKYLPENCRKNSLKFAKGSFLKIFKERSLKRLKQHQSFYD
jgi:glycosyltransferase involved in cell wall biosynthesis